MEIYLRMECEREGINPAAFERVVRHVGLVERDEESAADIIMPGFGVDFQARLDAAKEDAKADADDWHQQQCQEAEEILRRIYGTEGQARELILSAFDSLTMRYEDRSELSCVLEDALREVETEAKGKRDAQAEHVSFDRWAVRVLGGAYVVGRMTAKRAAAGVIAISAKRLAELECQYAAFFE